MPTSRAEHTRTRLPSGQGEASTQGPRSRRRRAGFTLLEMLAVVLMMALVTGWTVLELDVFGTSALRQQARRLATHLEFARQRAIMSGKAHRLLIDVEEGFYRVEWLVSAADFDGGPEGPGYDLLSGDPLDLTAPSGLQSEFEPVPALFGQDEWLDEGFFFEGVDTPEGWIDRGGVEIGFGRDGMAQSSQIVISDEDDRRIFLEIRPLLDVVRITEEEE